MEEQIKIKVLYVDDEEQNLVSFKASFRRYFSIFTANSATEAQEILKQNIIIVKIIILAIPYCT
jgi:response regulator RpfG family c-di-GMP phosphodiesterase